MIAHAGGIDEIILVIGVLLLFVLLRSARADPDEEPREGPCLYCGHPLGPETQRCPDCGFRSRRRSVRPSSTDAGR